MVKSVQILLRNEEKELVEKACNLLGISQAALARSLLLERTRKIIKENSEVIVSV